MQYDITRDTFHPDNNYSRVLMRQGSVLLDADWNEQHAILLHYMRTLAMDIFGRHAAPVSDPGFEIIATFTKVDPDWQEKIKARAAASPSRYAALNAMGPLDNALIIGPGRYYVDGILVVNDAPVLYRLPHGQLIDDVNFETVADTNQSFLIYLDVWERLVTSIQDDGIREKALGGPETCARAQVCWRVRTLQNPDAVDIDTFEPFGKGTLRAQARQVTASATPCVTAPDARYRGLENHLYRVEIHQGGMAAGPAALTGAPAPPLGTVHATFKWSRDNGAAVFPIRSFDGKTAELESLGRDRRFGLKSGDWVEYIDDSLDLRGQPGPLFEVGKACNTSLTVTLTPDAGSTAVLSSVLPLDMGKHPMLRLWNHAEGATFSGALPVTVAANDGWIELEDGVQIQFAPNLSYQAGDYWLIPARVATGDIEWPREPVAATATLAASSQPAARRPHGPRHHYAPLLQITADAHHVTITDRRCRIARLPCL